MIAVAIIAIAIVTLIGAQSQSVSIATSSKFDTMASLLAQQKMTELVLLDYDEVTDNTGDFGEDFPSFAWKSEVVELAEGDTGIAGSDGMLKTIDLTISVKEDAALSYSLRTIVCKLSVAP
jgi:general secretion pathway protein I